MTHKYAIGQDVYYQPPVRYSAAPGTYKIIQWLPVEHGHPAYRIKSPAESFERTADEGELSAD